VERWNNVDGRASCMTVRRIDATQLQVNSTRQSVRQCVMWNASRTYGMTVSLNAANAKYISCCTRTMAHA
jgi:hypothetical protein